MEGFTTEVRLRFLRLTLLLGLAVALAAISYSVRRAAEKQVAAQVALQRSAAPAVPVPRRGGTRLGVRRGTSFWGVVQHPGMGGRTGAGGVEAARPEGGTPDRFYFDAQTGLRLRVISRHHDAQGVMEQRVDYEDYREVDGVKLPFVIHETSGDSTLTIKINEVRHNVTLDDSQFAKSAVQ